MKKSEEMNEDRALAQTNLDKLLKNPYFGRLIMMGIDPDGQEAVIITAISGRSEGSRNRIYKKNDQTGCVYTAVADSTKQVGDPELTLYDTQAEDQKLGLFAASNGRQTGDCVSGDDYLDNLLHGWSFEPDKPNFTPRISGRLRTKGRGPIFEFFIHRKRDADGKCEMTCYGLSNVGPGFGYYVCTYEDNGDPLPPFVGGPRLITIRKEPLIDLAYGLASRDFLAAMSMKRVPLNNEGHSKITVWDRP